MAAIETSGLTKTYGRPMPIHPPGRPQATVVRALQDLTIEVGRGRDLRVPRTQRRGQVHDHPAAPRLPPPDGRPGIGARPRRRSAIRSRSGRASATCRAASRSGTALTGERLLDDLAALSGRPPTRRAELLDRLELSPATLRRPVRDYSRGMRQKLGIIQALQHDPELAILDEPTEGLDPLMQRAFYDDPRRPAAAGRTIFFSSHVLSEVERVCDRVAIVRHGRLVALEDIPTLLARRKRNVEMRLDGPPPALDGVPGVSDVRDRRRPAALPAGRRRGAVPGRHRRADDPRPDHRAGAARGGLPRVLRRRHGRRRGRRRGRGCRPARGRVVVNLALFAHTWRANRTRALIVAIALAVWGTFLPIIYDSFGSAVQGHLRERGVAAAVRPVRRRRHLLA